ncbi:hypothetical protein N7540_002481 [Penicillium herquei]|nr:hypothetical protein N7540_002481 [Penicillium herquei]
MSLLPQLQTQVTKATSASSGRLDSRSIQASVCRWIEFGCMYSGASIKRTRDYLSVDECYNWRTIGGCHRLNRVDTPVLAWALHRDPIQQSFAGLCLPVHTGLLYPLDPVSMSGL